MDEETKDTATQATGGDELTGRVQEVIERISKRLAMDGGGVELVAIEGDTAKVRLQGACAGCPMSQMTLKMFVESTLTSEIPEIKRVEAV